jgi:hypothetical protein
MVLMLAPAKIGCNPDTCLGAGDVAYRLIHNDAFPSWDFSPSEILVPAKNAETITGFPDGIRGWRKRPA